MHCAMSEVSRIKHIAMQLLKKKEKH